MEYSAPALPSPGRPTLGMRWRRSGSRTPISKDVDLSGVRGWWNAAERIHHDTFVEFHRRFEKFGVPWDRLRTNFGCAENIGGATFTRPGEPYRVEFVDRLLCRDEDGGSSTPPTRRR